MAKRITILLSGLFWLVGGFFLMRKGLFLTVHAGEQVSLIFVAAALIVGYLKGKFVLAKTARRMLQHILTLPTPLPWRRIYPFSYFLLIAAMFGMAALLNILPIPPQFRGFIDIAIGSALINGSMIYFRAFSLRTSTER